MSTLNVQLAPCITYSALIYDNLSIKNAERHAISETLRAGIYGVGLGVLNDKGLKVKPPNFLARKVWNFICG